MTDVSRETTEKLDHYARLIEKWNPKINLVARSTLQDVSDRHIRDSAQLAELVGPAQGKWLDLGSGGGLPGLVAAIHYADQPVDFHLVESDQRKATFLRTCMRELGLTRVTIHPARIESLIPATADIVSARALAPLPLLMSYVERHLKQGGTAWLMKGENWRDELRDAEVQWRFRHVAHPSQTQKNAAILEVSDVSHV
jgi:16S rRNA (guanine527-N7)-methyltransferase